jgi:hypothetical protein
MLHTRGGQGAMKTKTMRSSSLVKEVFGKINASSVPLNWFLRPDGSKNHATEISLIVKFQ